MFARVSALIALCLALATASPLGSRSLAVRGGGEGERWGRKADETADEIGTRARRTKERALDIRFEQAIPLATGAFGVVQSLGLLLAPGRLRTQDSTGPLTSAEKAELIVTGARTLPTSIAILKLALHDDDRSLRLANGIALGAALLEEGVTQFVTRDDGISKPPSMGGLSEKNQNIASAIRTVISAGTIWALYALRGNGRLDNDYA